MSWAISGPIHRTSRVGVPCFQERQQQQHEADEQEDVDEIAGAEQTHHAKDPYREQGKSKFEEHVASHRSDSFQEANVPLQRHRGGEKAEDAQRLGSSVEGRLWTRRRRRGLRRELWG
jgi:hypothetical protein